MNNIVSSFVLAAAIAGTVSVASAQSSSTDNQAQTEQLNTQQCLKADELKKKLAERLKADGRDVKIIEQFIETKSDGSSPITKGKVIVVDKDGNVTEKEITDANKAEIEQEIDKELKSAEGTGAKKCIVINSNECKTISTGNGSNFSISTGNGTSTGGGKARAFTFRSNGGRGGSCNINVQSDSTAKGKCFAITLDGVNESLREELKELKSHLTELRGELKTMDKDVQDRVKSVLKNLKINVNMPDSLMVFSIDASDKGSDGVHAEVRAFMANDDTKTATPPDASTSVSAVVSEDNGSAVKKRIYVIRSNKAKNGKEQSLTTETLNSKEGLNLNEFSMFPNPTDDGRFTLKFALPNEGATTLRITDMNGREVVSESLGSFSGTYEKLHDLSTFGKGVYLIGVTQNGKTATMKVVLE
ncbi:MAG: T9SS type A sorting domain-containing protein [Candidatus Kapabacteria bacterium]|nr:T9SS type A sorting domain-containing protein [Candidatus Kapabacteria bacterium]